MTSRLSTLAIGMLLFAAPLAVAQQVEPQPSSFEAIPVFAEHCASCHDRPGATRAPSRDALRERTPEAILNALTNGAMAVQGRALTDRQRRALAVLLSGRIFGASGGGAASSMPNRCEPKPAANPVHGPAWNGWGNGVANTRFQPEPGFSAEQVPNLTLKWAFGVPNAATMYMQPTVVGGRVYVGSDANFVYALDAASGCVFWSFEAKAGVRTAVSVAPLKGAGGRHAVYFGDVQANVYGVDAETGNAIWTVRVDTHPLARITGAPTLYDGTLYVPVSSHEEAASHPNYECCTFRGSVVALDGATGRQIWKSYTIPREPAPTRKTSKGTQRYGPSGAAIWSSPTIDIKRQLVYVATGDAYSHPAEESSDAIIAFDLATGRRRWVRQLLPNDVFLWGCDPNHGLESGAVPAETCPEPAGPDLDFGSSPILATLPNGRTIITAGQKSGIAWGLDPDQQGKILWQQRVGQASAGGGVVFGPAVHGDRGYFATADHELGEKGGGLSAVNLVDGSLLWSVKPSCLAERKGLCRPAQSAAITVIPGAVFSGSADGVLRAYSMVDGHVIWQFDTAREFEAVNRVPAKGGSLGGPGPVAAGGMLFVVSGYGGSGAGNVLLAFAAQP